MLRLPKDSTIDVEVLVHGGWDAAVGPGWGRISWRGWRLAMRRPSRPGCSPSAAIRGRHRGDNSRGRSLISLRLTPMRSYAVRLVGISPYDEDHLALLIPCYSHIRRRASCPTPLRRLRRSLLQRAGPGPAVRTAMLSHLFGRHDTVHVISVKAINVVGAGAMAANASNSGGGIRFGAAVALADRSEVTRLRVESRLALAEAVIHSLRGEDEEGTKGPTPSIVQWGTSAPARRCSR